MKQDNDFECSMKAWAHDLDADKKSGVSFMFYFIAAD